MAGGSAHGHASCQCSHNSRTCRADHDGIVSGDQSLNSPSSDCFFFVFAVLVKLGCMRVCEFSLGGCCLLRYLTWTCFVSHEITSCLHISYAYRCCSLLSLSLSLSLSFSPLSSPYSQRHDISSLCLLVFGR